MTVGVDTILGKVWDNNINGPLGEHTFLITFYSNQHFVGFIWIIWPRGQSPTKVITVHDTPPYGHAPTYQISLIYLVRQKSYDPDKLRWEEAEAEEKSD